MSTPLYTPAILRLAAHIPHHQRLADPHATIHKLSPVCGSQVTVDIRLDAAGRVEAFGQEVRACVLGQAAAAILGQQIIGQSGAELAAVHQAFATFLAGGPVSWAPCWAALHLLEPARPYTARHASLLLAFAASHAAVEAALGKTKDESHAL